MREPKRIPQTVPPQSLNFILSRRVREELKETPDQRMSNFRWPLPNLDRYPHVEPNSGVVTGSFKQAWNTAGFNSLLIYWWEVYGEIREEVIPNMRGWIEKPLP